MESYYGKCGRCRYCNLYNKSGGKFKCTLVANRWVLATEKACCRFEGGYQTDEDVDKARSNRL